MAKSNSGKWVSRVGSAGGGKSYQKSRPTNFYGALVLIVALGLALVVYSRFEYQNPQKNPSSTVAPKIGATWYAALSTQICGSTESNLTPDPSSEEGFLVESSNVIQLSPLSNVDSGNNATLKTFATEYPGLVASTTQLGIPNADGKVPAADLYTNGEKCPSGTKDAGQKGKVVYAYWSTLAQKKPTLTTKPGSIKFVKDMRLTMAFEPSGVVPSAPSAATVDAMVEAATTPTTTTTTPVTTTTAVTTTTSSTTTTTAPKG